MDEFAMPNAEEWAAAAKVGELTAQRALSAEVELSLDRGSAFLFLPILMGAIVETTRMMAAMANGDPALLEKMLVAHVRGSIRGLEGPCDEAGNLAEQFS